MIRWTTHIYKKKKERRAWYTFAGPTQERETERRKYGIPCALLVK